MTQAKRTTRAELEELHKLLTDHFLDWMRQPEKYNLKPFHLAVIRQFLKDNGITKNLTQARDVKKSLEELGDLEVPFDLPQLQ